MAHRVAALPPTQSLHLYLEEKCRLDVFRIVDVARPGRYRAALPALHLDGQRLEALGAAILQERPTVLGAVTGLAEPPGVQRTRLFPILRPPGYADALLRQSRGALEAMRRLGKNPATGSGASLAMTSATREFREGLRLDLVVDLGDHVVPVTGSGLEQNVVDACWRTALLNLEAHSMQPFQATAWAGVSEGPWHDDYDASRALLLPSVVRTCAVKGEHLVFAPAVHRAWVVGSEDAEGLSWTLDAVDAFLASGAATSPYAFRQLLFGWPWLLRDGALVRWSPPDGSAVAARIASLDATLSQRRATAAKQVESFTAVAMSEAAKGLL